MVSHVDAAKSAVSRVAATDAAYRRFFAAYPCIQSPTDRVRAAFDRAAAPFTDPGVIVAAAEMFAIAVRTGEVLDREVPTEVFWLESGQFKAWIPPSPGGGMPPAVAPVRVEIGELLLTTAIRASAVAAVGDAITMILCGADKPRGETVEAARCRS